MYLISVYFDDATNKRIQSYINQVAKQTGNRFMIEGKVPPHITVTALEASDEQKVIAAMEQVLPGVKRGTLQWASLGQFFPHVIFITPVLNEYMQMLSQNVHEKLHAVEGMISSPYYQPFRWLPHTTIAKHLTETQMRVAFEVMQKSFGMFEGEVVEIGLAKTNPYQDLAKWKLMEE